MQKVKTTAFTLATPHYLAHALSLRHSYFLHNSGDDFIIGFIGEKGMNPRKDESQYVYLDELKDERIRGMTERYNPFELSSALKPFFAAHILTHHQDVERLIYLDSDMLVFGEFQKMTDAAITIAPHRTTNVNYLPGTDNFSMLSLLRYGVYNAGYFELLNRPVSLVFLNWWQGLMEDHAYDKPDENLFTDQLWLSTLPSFFDDYFINKDPGYNAAFWNLLERKFVKINDQWMVNGCPLVFFHFAKHNINEPERMADFDHPFLTFTRFPELRPIFEQYRRSLEDHGYREFIHLPYPFTPVKSRTKKPWWKTFL